MRISKYVQQDFVKAQSCMMKYFGAKVTKSWTKKNLWMRQPLKTLKGHSLLKAQVWSPIMLQIQQCKRSYSHLGQMQLIKLLLIL